MARFILLVVLILVAGCSDPVQKAVPIEVATSSSQGNFEDFPQVVKDYSYNVNSISSDIDNIDTEDFSKLESDLSEFKDLDI